MLAEGHSTCVAPEQRESVLLEPQSEGMREISKRFQDCLDAFTGVVERLAMQRGSDDDDVVMGQLMGQFGGGGVSQLIGFPNAATPQKLLNGVAGGLDVSTATAAQSAANNALDSVPFGGSGGAGGDRVWETVFSWEQRLLCCMANCAYAKKVFFAQLGTLFERHGYPRPKAAIDAARENVMQLFGTLLDMYVEQKSDPLVGTIEPSMYIGRFQWDAVPHTGKLRPYAHECLDNLVSAVLCTECHFLIRSFLPGERILGDLHHLAGPAAGRAGANRTNRSRRAGASDAVRSKVQRVRQVPGEYRHPDDAGCTQTVQQRCGT